MKLSDRLNIVLENRGLGTTELPDDVPVQEEEHQFTVEPDSIQFATFDDLAQMLKGADKVQPDEDGVRVVCVKDVSLREMCLPAVRGKFIIDDIQRNGTEYEVHLVENPLHERQT